MTTDSYYRRYDADSMAVAMDTYSSIINNPSKFLMYKDIRPIRDLKQMIETSAELYGGNTAFMQKFEKNGSYESITYDQMLETVNAYGTALIARGLKGSRIAVIGETCSQWEMSYLAVVCGTGIVVPLDKELNAAELKQLVKTAEVTAVICNSRHEETFLKMKEDGDTGIQTIIGFNAEENSDEILSMKKLVEEGRELVAKGDRSFIDAQIDPEEMQILLFTSGTTGIAKGVMLNHRNICTDLMIAPIVLKVYDWDIFFSVLPVHHTYECTCAFLMPLYKGAAIAYAEGLKSITKNLKEVRPTMMLGVPALFETLYKAINKNLKKSGKEKTVKAVMKLNKLTKKIGLDLNRRLLGQIYEVFGGRMRLLISGGAAIDPAILQFFNDLGILAVQGYGLTECAPMAALNPDVPRLMRNSSVGRCMPTLEARIENPDENGIGEICIKGRNVMMGYYGMPEETAKAIVDGWYHTGDLGYIDADDFIYITGRAKNVIITNNGKNVFPEELEYYLSLSPIVRESMVWAAKDDAGHDDVITATVVPDYEEIKEAYGEAVSEDDAQVERLIQEVVDRYNSDAPLFKQIRRIVLRHEELEKNTSRKVKRFAEGNRQ